MQGLVLGDNEAHTLSLNIQRPTPVPLGPKTFKKEDTEFGCDIDQVHTFFLRLAL